MACRWLVDREGRNALDVGRTPTLGPVGSVVTAESIDHARLGPHWLAVRLWVERIARGPVELWDDAASGEWEPWDGVFRVAVGWKVWQVTEPVPPRRRLWRPAEVTAIAEAP